MDAFIGNQYNYKLEPHSQVFPMDPESKANKIEEGCLFSMT